MSTADTTTEAFADTRPGDAADLPDYAPIPKSALGPAEAGGRARMRCGEGAASS